MFLVTPVLRSSNKQNSMAAGNFKSCVVKDCKKRKDLDDKGFCPSHNNSTQHCPPLSSSDQPLSDNCDCFTCGSVVLDTDKSLACELCKLFFHITCAKIPESVYFALCDANQIIIGLRWFCAGCIEQVEKLKSDCNDGTDVQACHNTSIHPSNKIDDLNNQKPLPICRDYRHGKCKHGLSGNKRINGQTCKFRHPKKCIKFCKFGKSGPKGCNGARCEFFHPILCRYALKKSECLDKSCTYTHLMGTPRTKKYSRDAEEYRSDHISRKSNVTQKKFSDQCAESPKV